MGSSVLSLVERGWQGTRQCSLALDARGVPVMHLIKGRLGRDVRAMIRRYPLIRILDVPRPLFPAWVWGILVTGTAVGRVRWILVDNARMLTRVAWWCRRFRLTPVLIRERDRGYELWVADRLASLEEVLVLGKFDFTPQKRGSPQKRRIP